MIDNDHKINPFSPDFSHRVDELYENKDNPIKKLNKNGQNPGMEEALLLTTKQLLPKIKSKLPQHFNAHCIVSQKAFEQCTSETLALWKAQNFPAETVLSLTGGLGVDDWAWNKSGSAVTSLDPDAQLNAVVQQNWKRLQMDAQRITTTAEDWLKANSALQFHLIYIDPDRRPLGGRKSHQAEDYLPNVFALLQLYGKMGKNWLIKLSPMTDPHWIFHRLDCYTEIFSMGFRNEAKEILVWVDPSRKRSELPRIDCIEITELNSHFGEGEGSLDPSNTENETQIGDITASWIKGERFSELELEALAEHATDLIWEPSPALFASSLHTTISQRFHLLAATPNPGFFHTRREIPAAFGRCLLVHHTFQGSLRKIAQQIKTLNISQLNVTPRSCGIPTQEIAKILQLKDGGPHTLFITKKQNEFQAWLGEIKKF